jgi:hypothetical protein
MFSLMILVCTVLVCVGGSLPAQAEIAFEATAGVCDAAQGQAIAAPGLSIEAMVEAQTAQKVCRGRCTYESGPTSTFTTPCNSSCKCDATVNGFPLYQYSCGYVSVTPVGNH